MKIKNTGKVLVILKIYYFFSQCPYNDKNLFISQELSGYTEESLSFMRTLQRPFFLKTF